MPAPIRISIDTSQYKPPTQEDITSAKRFILRRNDYARLLESKVDDQLEEAAENIVTICYKYNVDPKDFYISSRYNEKMMSEIAAVMDNLEEEVMSLIFDYSTATVPEASSSRKQTLLAWLVTLGRKNRNLQGTLDTYLYKTMKDWEAAIAALRYAGASIADAITRLKSNLHTIYTMPEVMTAFKEADTFNATYIRSRGVEKGAVGLSNNGSTNVTNMAKTTLQMAWMREQGIDFEQRGAAGYYQLRGSSYPCDICDDEVGFHEGLEDIYTKPLPHPHCCCYRIPIFSLEKDKEGIMNNASKQIKTLKETIDQYEGYEIENEMFVTGKLRVLRRSLQDIMEHGKEDLTLMQWLSSFSFDKIKNWNYEGWAENRPYPAEHPKYDPKNPNKKKHPETDYFLYYSLKINGKTYWANVKIHKNYNNGEVLYTIENKKPKYIITGKRK